MPASAEEAETGFGMKLVLLSADGGDGDEDPYLATSAIVSSRAISTWRRLLVIAVTLQPRSLSRYLAIPPMLQPTSSTLEPAHNPDDLASWIT